LDTPWKRANTDWLRDAKWGTMTHFLSDPPGWTTDPNLTGDEWNRRVDAVDVDRLAAQVAETGAGYHVFTVGQNTGYYCAPNETYDAIVGKPSKLSRRDLVGELAVALARRGVRTIAYSPACAPIADRKAVEALKFTPSWDMTNNGLPPGTYLTAPEVDDRLSEALRNWEAVVRDWSIRWGSSIAGWWIDGCYYADRLYRHADAPNFRSFAEALKSGNPDSIVAFNPGVKMPVVSLTEYEDYTAGELNDLWIGNKWQPLQRFIDGAQLHVMTYLGDTWCEGAARIGVDIAAGFTNHIIKHEGVVTWDTPVQPDGLIPDSFRDTLNGIGKAVLAVRS